MPATGGWPPITRDRARAPAITAMTAAAAASGFAQASHGGRARRGAPPPWAPAPRAGPPGVTGRVRRGSGQAQVGQAVRGDLPGLGPQVPAEPVFQRAHWSSRRIRPSAARARAVVDFDGAAADSHGQRRLVFRKVGEVTQDEGLALPGR